jgi:tetratricopeptide (TPR) repeat protein
VDDGMTLTDPADPADPADLAGTTPDQVAWPVLSGELPPLAEAYNPRPETGLGYITSLPPGETLVLADQGQPASQSPASTQSQPKLSPLKPSPLKTAQLQTAQSQTAQSQPSAQPAAPPAPGGGTGKTQLAVAAARNLWQSGAVELLVWTQGSSRDAILTGYVRAFDAIGVHPPREEAGKTAARFLAWLAETTRPWLVVIDGLTDLAALEGLWPSGASGRVLLTTRLPAESLTAPKRRVVQIGTFSPRESVSYLAARLAGDPDQRTGVLDLATDLAGLPLAVAQAASMMIDSRIGCREYRLGYGERKRRMTADGEHFAIVSATWLLSLERADILYPAGLAWPALLLIALLGQDGIPETVLTSRAACEYISGDQAAAEQVHGVLANLARVGLVALDSGGPAPAVWMHELVQYAIRQMIPAAQLDQAVRAAADALVQAWPKTLPPGQARALRACTEALRAAVGEKLWIPDGHPVLLRAGVSLDAARLTGPAVEYWEDLAATGAKLLGSGHPSSLLAGDKLAGALEAAGRPGDAVVVYEQGLAERGRVLGWRHADTLTTRSRLGQACLASGLHTEAISLQESTLAGREWALGKAHPDTLTSRTDLARAYLTAGRLDDAVSGYESALTAHETALGPQHPSTLALRADLASALQAAGRPKHAVSLQEETLRECERLHGPAHPDTIAARAGLAFAYRSAGRMKEALPLYKQTLAERERTLGPDHPDTLTARANLASAYHAARKYKEAILLYERTLAGREKIQGDDHPDTLVALGNLAAAYHAAGRMVQAIPLYEKTLASYLRVYGREHPDTLLARANLAAAYQTGGRVIDAITTLEWTLTECERSLPPDHPLTKSVRDRLTAAREY